MYKSKPWAWDKDQSEYWLIPSEESIYLAMRWHEKGYKSFLDLGCGRGRHSLLMAQVGMEVSAVDLSEIAVEETKQRLSENGYGGDVRLCDMLSLPFEDNSFDCILSYNVISHTDSEGIVKVLSELRRVLKPGGEFYLTLCSKETWSFTQSGFPRIDENTLVKVGGAEDGIPHFYVNLDDIMRLFADFDLYKIRHIDDCYIAENPSEHKGRGYGKHYFIHGARPVKL